MKSYLDKRKLVGTQVRIEQPNYINLNLKIKLIFQKNITEIDALRKNIEKKIRKFLHPVFGDLDEKGQKFGKELSKNDIFLVFSKLRKYILLKK